jgi:hypothetical protein
MTMPRRSYLTMAALLTPLFAFAQNRVELISRTPAEAANGASEFASISADGTVIAFDSQASNLVAGDTNQRRDVFVREAGTLSIAVRGTNGEPANQGAGGATLSASGRFLLFGSDSTNLVVGDNNGQTDVFWRDRTLNDTRLLSRNGATLGNATSAR